MRVMNLPELPAGPSSVDECIGLYVDRLPADEFLWPRLSLSLTAYMAWPNAAAQRDSWIASYIALFIQNCGDAAVHNASKLQDWTALENFGGLGAIAKPALDHLTDEIAQTQREWLWVADIFHKIVDIAHDVRVPPGGGPSISKAVELCELEVSAPGHSQLRRAWSDFRDVAHLLTAGAYLAHGGINKVESQEASILKAIWIAPDAVLALASGFQEFGLQPQPVRNKSTILQRDTLWRVPPALIPEKPFVPFRLLTKEQLEYLQTRRAAKKYSPATAPIRGHRRRAAD